jgi:hypothetical protein
MCFFFRKGVSPILKGIQGVQGVQGAQGVQGVKGVKGLKEFKGVKGVKRVNGFRPLELFPLVTYVAKSKQNPGQKSDKSAMQSPKAEKKRASRPKAKSNGLSVYFVLNKVLIISG